MVAEEGIRREEERGLLQKPNRGNAESSIVMWFTSGLKDW